MCIKKIVYVVLGCISVGLGAIGAVLPILPTVPFLMLAAFCFARSSERLNQWFIQTKLYKNNLETFVKGEGMTKKTKIRIMVTVTILMGIGFMMMRRVPAAHMILVLVWIFHILYFTFCVKNYESESALHE